MRLFRRRDALACREAVELIAASLDDALPPADASRLLRHLARCGDCAEYLAQVRATRDLAARTPPPAVADDTRERMTEMYREWRRS